MSKVGSSAEAVTRAMKARGLKSMIQSAEPDASANRAKIWMILPEDPLLGPDGYRPSVVANGGADRPGADVEAEKPSAFREGIAIFGGAPDCETRFTPRRSGLQAMRAVPCTSR